MRNKYLFLVMLTSLVISLDAYALDKDYCNQKYEYCISYPDMFIGQEEPDAHDGKTFFTKDKQSELLVWGAYLLENETIPEIYQRYKSGKITYKLIQKDYFVMSGIENEKIFYQKLYLRDNKISSFKIVYPKSKKTIFDKVIAKLKIRF